MNPEFEDENPVNPFDFWTGANFRLKVRKVEGWPNYDKSEFDTPSPLFEDDSKLEEVYDSLYSLQELVAPEKFKSYDELKSRLDRVLGLAGAPARPRQEEEKPAWRDEPGESQARSFGETRQSTVASDDDDDEDWFKRLAEED